MRPSHIYDKSDLPDRIIINSPTQHQPVISYGVAVMAKDTGRWLMVKHCSTPNFSQLVRGNYRTSELDNIIHFITVMERDNMMACCTAEDPAEAFGDLYATLFFDHPKNRPGGSHNFSYALKRFMDMRETLLARLPSVEGLSDIEWSWPKGRRYEVTKEPGFDAARRELEEETGVSASLLEFVRQTPVIGSYRSNNGRVYETQCWVATIEKEEQLAPPPPSGEIGLRAWVSPRDFFALTAEIDCKNVIASTCSKRDHFKAILRVMIDENKLVTDLAL